MASFTDDESFLTPRRIVGVFVGIGLLLAIFLGGPAVFDRKSGLFSRTTTPEQIERALTREPGLQDMMNTFRQLYPTEYQGLLRQLSDKANSEGEQAASREAFHYMRRFMVSKTEAVISAPTADLQRFSAALLEVHQALRRSDVPLCAQFVMRGFAPGDRIPPGVMEALGRANVAQLQAARHAETGSRVDRAALSEDDAAAWFQRLESIDAGSAALVSSDGIGRADPQAQCNAGVSIYQAMVDLPPDQSANVAAEFIRESSRAMN